MNRCGGFGFERGAILNRPRRVGQEQMDDNKDEDKISVIPSILPE